MWLYLDFPSLPLEVFPPIAKHQAATIVVTGSTHQAAIEAVNAAALAMGIHAGMSLAAAWCCAQQPLLVVQRDKRAEEVALEALALWAGQYSSMVSIIPPQGIVLEVGRSFDLFDGMRVLHQTVRQDLKKLFYSVRLGMAPTPMGAELLARANIEQPVTDRRELIKSLTSLSVDFLEDGSGIAGMLSQIGVRKIGDCIALPRKEVSQRLGQNLWRTLDRVLGFAPDPRPCFVPPARFRRTLALPAPVDQAAALRFVMRRLLAELTAFLRIQQQGVERMVVELGGPSGELQSLAVGFADATRDPQRLAGMVESHLENCSLQHRVEHVALIVQAMQPVRDRHGALFVNPLEEPDSIVLLLDQLNARLGEERVSGLCLQAEHRPEYSWRYCQPGCVSTVVFQPRLRPLWLLEKPFPIRSGKSCLMWGRRKLHVEQGPERIESGWWDGHGIARDYYVARAAGGAMLWVFCERRGRPRWYAHGFFA